MCNTYQSLINPLHQLEPDHDALAQRVQRLRDAPRDHSTVRASAARRRKQRRPTHDTVPLWQLRQRPSIRLLRTGPEKLDPSPRRAWRRKESSILDFRHETHLTSLALLLYPFAVRCCSQSRALNRLLSPHRFAAPRMQVYMTD